MQINDKHERIVWWRDFIGILCVAGFIVYVVVHGVYLGVRLRTEFLDTVYKEGRDCGYIGSFDCPWSVSYPEERAAWLSGCVFAVKEKGGSDE